jgi:hypothetical protein
MTNSPPALATDRPHSPQIAVGNMDDYLMAMHFNNLWQYDEKLVALHGMSYALREFRLRDGCEVDQALIVNGCELRAASDGEALGLPLGDFVAQNQGYLEKVVALVERYIMADVSVTM